MEFVKSLWRGEEGLAFTTWGMAFFAPLLLNLILRALDYVNLGGLYFKEGQDVADGWYITLPYMAYTWFILICMWRAATIYIDDAKTDVRALWGKSIWGYLTKVVVVFNVPFLLFMLYTFLISI